jgi:hypothetical protein
MSFKPLPVDYFEYYPVEPTIILAWSKLWLDFRKTCETECQRQKLAQHSGLPRNIGVLRPNIAHAFVRELSEQKFDKAVHTIPYYHEAPKELAALLARLICVDVDQPILTNILHSWINYDVQYFPPNEPAMLRISFDNRIVIPNETRADVWHPDDGEGMIFRPSRRYTMRTSIPFIYVDANGKEASPKPGEAMVMTGDTSHISFNPSEPTPSKYLQLGIFPYPQMT